MRRRHAFTLTELVVVVTLLGIVAVTVSVRLAPATDRARLRGATLTIEQTLKLARHRAMTKHQPVWIEFRPDGTYRTRFAPHAGQPNAPWRSLANVRIQATNPRRRHAGQPTTIRLTPSGASLRWALELRSGLATRVVWSEGVHGRVKYRDDIGLDAFTWDSVE